MPLWANDLLECAVFVVALGGGGLAFYRIIKCGVRGCWRQETAAYDPELRTFVCVRHDPCNRPDLR